MTTSDSEKAHPQLPHAGTSDVNLVETSPTSAQAHEDHYAVRVIDIPENKWLRRYRSVAFQMFLLGCLSFSGPSMSDAISSLGGGGQATPYTANTASSAQYAASSVFAMLGGPLVSAIGIPSACVIGALGFPLSGAGFYVLSKYKIQWFLIFAKAIYGITTSFLYVAESTSMLSYPEENHRGFYISIWLCARNLGSVIAGGISMGLNIKGTGKGAVTSNTYLVFLGLECIGLPAALLLTKTRKVIRADGYGVPMLLRKSWKQEMKLLWQHHKQRRTLLMVPVYIYTFFGDGVFFTYLGVHFSVRARAVSALLAPVATIVLNPLFGMILDKSGWGPRFRGKVAFFMFMFLAYTLVIWGMVMTSYFQKHDTILDYKANAGLWFVGYVPFLFYYVFSYSGQTLVYWTLGQFASDVQTNARTGGVFRAWETVGQAIAYGVDSNVRSPWVSISMLLGLTVISTPCLWLVINEIPKENRLIVVANENGLVPDGNTSIQPATDLEK